LSLKRKNLQTEKLISLCILNCHQQDWILMKTKNLSSSFCELEGSIYVYNYVSDSGRRNWSQSRI